MLTFEFSLPLRIPFSHPKTVRNPYFIVKSWEKAGYWTEFWHETLKRAMEDGRPGRGCIASVRCGRDGGLTAGNALSPF